MKLFSWLKLPKRYRHPLANERRDLADQLSGWDIATRESILAEVAHYNPELYESWMLEPYPGRGDR